MLVGDDIGRSTGCLSGIEDKFVGTRQSRFRCVIHTIYGIALAAQCPYQTKIFTNLA